MPEIVLTRIRRGWLTRPACRRDGRAVVHVRTAAGPLTIPVRITALSHHRIHTAARFQVDSATSLTAGAQR